MLLSRLKGQDKGGNQGLAELALREVGLGGRRYSTSRQLQKATCRVSVVTRMMMEWQNTEPSEQVSRMAVRKNSEVYPCHAPLPGMPPEPYV
jgi:hypothetical protein